jgi:hypothetical protein
VGSLDLLLRQEAQGLRAARGGALVVRLRREFSHPGGFSAVAPQTLVRRARLPHQAPAGGSHAQGGHRLGLEARYIVFDTHYSAGWFTRMGLVWVGTLHPRTILYWRGERCVAGELAGMLPLKW